MKDLWEFAKEEKVVSAVWIFALLLAIYCAVVGILDWGYFLAGLIGSLLIGLAARR